MVELKITGMENEVSKVGDIPPPIKPAEPIEAFTQAGYTITQDWFTKNSILWGPLLKEHKPARILEIGSFEGLSTIFMIENCSQYGNVEIHCVDTWSGGVEHDALDFDVIEERFEHNVQVALEKSKGGEVLVHKHKGRSVVELSKLIAAGTPKFDFIYVDGSHLAKDVLTDATLAFELLNLGGVLVFDDYSNPNPVTPEFPTLGIECFLSAFRDKVGKIRFVDEKGEPLEKDNKVLYQLFLRRIA